MKRQPDEAPEREGGESFVSRWSRRKSEARQAPPERAPEKAADAEGPAPELPPLDQLTRDSDYRPFFHPKVGENVRRAALKKLFSDPHFNMMDGLDVYIDDYSKTEPIPPEMMAGLRQAQKILQWAKEDEEQRAQEQRAREHKALQETPAQATEPPNGQSPSATESRLDAADAALPPAAVGSKPSGSV